MDKKRPTTTNNKLTWLMSEIQAVFSCRLGATKWMMSICWCCCCEHPAEAPKEPALGVAVEAELPPGRVQLTPWVAAEAPVVWLAWLVLLLPPPPLPTTPDDWP